MYSHFNLIILIIVTVYIFYRCEFHFNHLPPPGDNRITSGKHIRSWVTQSYNEAYIRLERTLPYATDTYKHARMHARTHPPRSLSVPFYQARLIRAWGQVRGWGNTSIKDLQGHLWHSALWWINNRVYRKIAFQPTSDSWTAQKRRISSDLASSIAADGLSRSTLLSLKGPRVIRDTRVKLSAECVFWMARLLFTVQWLGYCS